MNFIFVGMYFEISCGLTQPLGRVGGSITEGQVVKVASCVIELLSLVRGNSHLYLLLSLYAYYFVDKPDPFM